MAGKLRARGYPEEDVAALVARLADGGLVSDARFSAAFVRSRSERGYGPLRIAYELRRRGVDDDVAGMALAPHEAEWPGRARRVRRKRFGANPPIEARERARQMRFLEQRGFDHAQVRAALDGAREEADDGAEVAD